MWAFPGRRKTFQSQFWTACLCVCVCVVCVCVCVRMFFFLQSQRRGVCACAWSTWCKAGHNYDVSLRLCITSSSHVGVRFSPYWAFWSRDFLRKHRPAAMRMNVFFACPPASSVLGYGFYAFVYGFNSFRQPVQIQAKTDSICVAESS